MRKTFQRWLLLFVVAAFCITLGISYWIQTEQAREQAVGLIDSRLENAKTQISGNEYNLWELRLMNQREAAAKVRALRRLVAENDLYSTSEAALTTLLNLLDVDEIHITNGSGVIVNSTERKVIGYHMDAAVQSRAFLTLLEEPAQIIVQEPQERGFGDEAVMQYAGAAMENAPGIVQIGFYPERLWELTELADIANLAPGFHVGNQGGILVLDTEGRAVSAPEELFFEMLRQDPEKLRALADSGRAFTERDGGNSYLCLAETYGPYYLVGALPSNEMFTTRNQIVRFLIICNLILFIVVFLLVSKLVQRVVISGIYKVNDSLNRITDGDLDEKVDVTTNPEFTALSNGINSTVSALKDAIADATARIDKELEFARAIQYSSIPNVFPPYPDRTDFSIYAAMDSAKEVGGDFYDFFLLPDGRLGFVIADVSGKGVGAAMFMMTAKTQIKNTMLAGGRLEQVAYAVNNGLCEGNGNGMFVTAFLGICDFSQGLCTYVSAGHNPPLLRRSGGEYQWISGKRGFVLGGMEGSRYRVNTIPLLPGDQFYLYTDGVTEAFDREGRLFSEARLIELLNSPAFRELSPEALLPAVRGEVERFSEGAEQADDITMLSLLVHRTDKLTRSLTIPAEQRRAEEGVAFLNAVLRTEGCGEKLLRDMDVAADELITNIASYAYAPDKGEVTITCGVSGNSAYAVFTDGGRPYNPLEKPDPDVTLSAQEREIGGLGIYIVKKLMDTVEYVRRDGQNCVTIRKER